MRQTISLAACVTKKGQSAYIHHISDNWKLPIPRVGEGVQLSDGHSFLVREVNWVLDNDTQSKSNTSSVGICVMLIE